MDTPSYEKLLQEIQVIDPGPGLDMNDMLNLSDPLRQLLVWMIRKNAFQANELGNYLEIEPMAAQEIVDSLKKSGLIEEIDATQRFQLNMASTRSTRKYQVPKDVWKVFD
jgi:hypothetical protein